MNSLDSMVSFDIEPNSLKSTNRSRSENRETGSSTERRDGGDGLNFSQMLVDREERTEKAMSSNRQRHTDQQPETIAERESHSSTGEVDAEKSAPSDVKTIPDDAKLTDKTMPAIVAQSLAVQAQISDATPVGVSTPENPIEPTLAAQTVEALVSTIKESQAKDPVTAQAAKTDLPTLSLPKPSLPVGESNVPQTQGGAVALPTEQPANLHNAATAAINEIEEVIQGFLDEDADLDLPEPVLKTSKTTTTKAQAIVGMPSTPTPGAEAKSLASDNQTPTEVEDATSLAEATTDTHDEQKFDQNPAQHSPTQAEAPVESESGDPSGAIALDSVEVAATTQESATRSSLATNNRGTVAVEVARQIRQQVVQHIGQRMPNVMTQEKLTINLNPEKLGQVEVTFEPQGDRLMVMILASDRVAEAALMDDINELTERIVERSGRFNQVEIKVELKDGAESRQDNKQNDKNEERQGQKRDQQQKNDGSKNHPGFVTAESLETRQAWQSALDWQMNEESELQTVSEEK